MGNDSAFLNGSMWEKGNFVFIKLESHFPQKITNICPPNRPPPMRTASSTFTCITNFLHPKHKKWPIRPQATTVSHSIAVRYNSKVIASCFVFVSVVPLAALNTRQKQQKIQSTTNASRSTAQRITAPNLPISTNYPESLPENQQ